MIYPVFRQVTLLMCLVFSAAPYADEVSSSSSEEIKIKKIVWTGCGITKKAFMADIAAAYQQKYGVMVDLKGGGATKGIRATKAGISHMGGTCRLPLHNREEESMLLKLILVAWDALVVIVNNETPIQNITKQEIIDILNGDITYWSQLSGWQGDVDDKQTIDLFTRESNISGVGFTLRKMLFNDTNKIFKSKKMYPSSGPLEKAIEQEKYSLGITGISSARKRNVKVLTLDGISPDYETIKSGNYTMYRPLYLTYSSLYKLPKNEKKEVRRFLKFIKTDEAAQIIKANGVVPFKEGFHLMKQRKDIFGS